MFGESYLVETQGPIGIAWLFLSQHQRLSAAVTTPRMRRFHSLISIYADSLMQNDPGRFATNRKRYYLVQNHYCFC